MLKGVQVSIKMNTYGPTDAPYHQYDILKPTLKLTNSYLQEIIK